MIHQRKILKAIAYAILLCFTSLTGAQPLYAIPANTQLPTGPNGTVGIPHDVLDNVTTGRNGNTLTITQDGKTSVLEWGNFSIGADAAVEFKSTVDGFNSLNYVTGANAPISEIYGQLTALGGNIFIANPAGVQIGNSAQINVGSLYVTNKNLEDAVKGLNQDSTTEQITQAINGPNVAATNAELMSLGSIISTKNNVTFDGNRIVIDTERLYTNEDGAKMRGKGADGDVANENTIGGLTIKTEETNDVILGYDGTDGGATSFALNRESTEFGNTGTTTYHGYQWVRDLFQLQDMDTNLNGWYALRNSIDASYTANKGYGDGKGFNPIGNLDTDHPELAFTGRFDGLGYDIFGLTINRGDQNHVGLFGYVGRKDKDDAVAYVRNFTINSGSITGNVGVGSAIGTASAGTVIDNIINTADVTGKSVVGGIIGTLSAANRDIVEDIITEDPAAAGYGHLSNLINVGTVKGDLLVGGITGYLLNSTLDGTTYNLGAVSGINADSHNIGGIVGRAVHSQIGNIGTDGFQIYNQGAVTGDYNVGGIVGTMDVLSNPADTNLKNTVTNVANHGTVTATGYTAEDYQYHSADNFTGEALGTTVDANGLATVEDVNVANAGGIVGNANGATIENVLNDGDVLSEMTKHDGDTFHKAGNIGGVVGRAEDTTIDNATNRENSVAGAHNVGGIAGLLSGASSITNGTNDGGDITGTGARKGTDAVYERVRKRTQNPNGTYSNVENFIVGNIGGVAGYMYGGEITEIKDENGEKVEVVTNFIENSTNRGTVHTAAITDSNNVLESAKAANVGGIVGKVDMSGTPQTMESIKPGNTGQAALTADYANVSIRHSYNTGNVRGYTGVGGVAGMMYNGSVARSFNTGTVQTTRSNATGSEALNMGGIVGDTTEGTDARTMIYDVYNSGQIGDETYTYYGRHVGGVVGRLSGEIDKAYNTGNIYNGYSVTGGIVGWWYAGNISNVFNTGNITALNNNSTAYSFVGGIVGNVSAEGGDDKYLSYAYNLGTIRSFRPYNNPQNNYVSGIVGGIEGYVTTDPNYQLYIDNVYTLGNIYAGVETGLNTGKYKKDDAAQVSAIWNKGLWEKESIDNPDVDASVYIKPDDKSPFDPIANHGATIAINFGERNNIEKYKEAGMKIITPDTDATDGMENIPELGENGVTEESYSPWRIYNGTPILNVFLPYAEDYFSGDDANLDGIENIQYGTAYDPLLTIIHTDGSNLEFNWNELGITGAAGLAVYGNENGVGGGLTLNGYQANNNRYYGGTIYADGALNINVTGDHDGTFTITDGAHIYGSSVTINTNGSDALISGTIQATGNSNSKNDNEGSVTITSGKDKDGNNNDADIEILGSITSAKHNNGGVTIPSISGNEDIGWGDKPADVDGWADVISNPKDTRLPTYAEMYAHETNQYTGDDGTVNITTGGSASVLYGNMGKGSITSYGDFTITADKGVYLDSLMDLHGDLNLNSDGKIVLDFTGTGDVKYMHDNFLHRFTEENGQAISINDGKGGDFMMAVDLWQEADPNVENSTAGFDLGKYDVEGHNFKNELNALNIVGLGEGKEVRDVTHIWISDAYQLKGIQDYIASSKADAKNMLGYNFALKNNIDASVLTGEDSFTSIGANTDGYFGNFDGRGFRILGLNVNSDNAGLFSKLTTTTTQDGKTLTGTVSDLRIYASNFYGESSAGAVAGVNDGGVISGVTTLGNHVEAAGVSNEIIENTGITGAAGGIVGINKGQIKGSDASDMVIVKGGEDGKTVAAGGIAGVNAAGGVIGKELTGGELVIGGGEDADDYLVTADSAVTATGKTQGMGGAIGVNLGTATLVNSTGVTNGKQGDAFVVDNIGGVVGKNKGTMVSLYNESIVMGGSNVGGVVGTNSGTIENAVNATDVTADTNSGKNAGGIAGDNSGTIDSGRNAGTIEGHTNVAGMAGTNSGALMNLSNGLVASITGNTNVGGIAGTNAGDIKNDHNLVNEGKVYGNMYVGGIAGVNTEKGEIENVHSDTQVLNVNKAEEKKGEFFGGIVGQNNGTITDATNDSDVKAEGATFVGGIAGENNGNLEGELVNNGDVKGQSNVGGLAGVNTKQDLLVNVSVTNNGVITATDGSAGGIFYENTGKIENATLINNEDVDGRGYSHTGGLFGTNSGEIINSTLINNAHVKGDNNTGGLFGENTGNITNSTLINNGTVEGQNNTGGLFGVNSGNATGSSLINSVSGTVKGTGDNVGGLIGHNTGTITGGRGAGANGMTLYTDKIINNGTVTGKNNVSGLFGRNDGKLTAGYNTGHVEGASNVGGIAGLNNGAIDQAFNTVMTADGNNMISGASNAGGLVGFNAGTLTDAYNTTGVSGGGNAVGTNTGTIRNVYATNTTGRLINNNSGTASNVYTFAAGDGSARFVSEAERMFSRFYSGFGSAWKNYDGWSTPMLKVFLTQAGYSADTELVQTGYPMSLPIKGYVVAGDNLIAYDNANALLVALANTELGEDYLAFYSTQIAASGEGALFNPNNLGYDIDVRYSIVPLFEHNTGYLHWLHRGGDRERNFRERKAEIYFHEGGMVHEETM